MVILLLMYTWVSKTLKSWMLEVNFYMPLMFYHRYINYRAYTSLRTVLSHSLDKQQVGLFY